MSIIREMVIVGTGVVAFLYLVNPTMGIFELLPDTLPIVGNIDEAAMTLLLVNVLGYYGINLNRFQSTSQRLPRK